jgi:tetratricopeptide (TPR) repeat protein
MDRALEYRSDPAEVYWLYETRSAMWEYMGDFPAAIEDIVVAYEGSGEGGYLERAAALSVRMGDLEQANGFYERLLADFPGEPRYLIGQGYIAHLAGDRDRAAERAERALALDPSLLGAHYLLGILAFDAGDFPQALAEFELVSQEPETWMYDFPFFTPDFGHEIHLDMARAALAMGDLELAQEHISQSLALDEWRPWPHIVQAQILMQQGDLAGAREHLVYAQETTEDPAILDEIDRMLAELTE